MALALVLASTLAGQEPAANAAASVTICGRVVDADGEPLPKAGVVVSTDPDFTTAAALAKPRVRCGADGSFEVVLEPSKKRGASTELLIAAPGKVAFSVPNVEHLVFVSASRHPSRVDLGVLCLPDGFTMTGRVRGPDGKPLAGARIHATDCLSTYPWMAATFGSRATTNASGVFVLAGVFGQAMAVTVHADGCYEKRLPCVDLAQPLDVQLEASGFVEGTLLDETGKPADGFVHATYELLGASDAYGVRAVAGKWKLPIVQPCRLFVYASREGDAFQWWSGPETTASLLAGPTQGVELRFGADAAKCFTITAVGGDGAKVAPIRAAFLPDNLADQIEDRMQRFATRSGPDGAVRVWSPFGRGGVNSVVVLADGFAPFVDKKVGWRDGGSYEAKLVPECRIAGRVLDAATGQPVAGALVTCERVRQKVEESMPIVPVATAADGSFTWRGLGAQPCLVTARHAGGTANVSKRVKWKGAGEQQEVELSLPAGVTVSGKVTGPLQPRWRVHLAAPRSQSERISFYETGVDELGLQSTSALADGAFRFEHRGEAAEELQLVVPLPPRQGGALRVPLEKVITRKGDEVVDVDVSKVLPGAIAGKVALRGADFPVGRLAVVAIRSGANDQGAGYAAEHLGRRSWQLAGADGAFRIPAVAGHYTLEAIDVATGVVLLSAREEIEVVAGAVRTQDFTVDVIDVHVRCEARGRKQLGANRVDVQPPDGGDWEPKLFGGGMRGTAGAEIDQRTGSARLFLPPGTFRLCVRVGATPMQGVFSWGNEPSAAETIEATPGKVHEVTLELPEPADPTGK